MHNLDENKTKALNTVLARLEKNFGKNTLMRMGDNRIEAVATIPTGSLALDLALGIGGLPKGRVIEIYGPESSGKTTMTLHAIAECQKAGGVCAFIDAEHALDAQYARKLGVDVDNLYLSQPDYGEQALAIVDEIVNSGVFNLIVVDSVAALTPKAEVEGQMGDNHVGLQARLMSQALRKLTASVNRSNCIVFFINQIRVKISMDARFPSTITTTGGNALKFYASVRLSITKHKEIRDGENAIGTNAEVKVVKNKLAPPFKVAKIQIMYGSGINFYAELVELAATADIVQRAGSWYSYDGKKIGQGMMTACRFMQENPDIAKEIEAKVRDHHAAAVVPVASHQNDLSADGGASTDPVLS